LGAYRDLVEYINKIAGEEGKEYLHEYIKSLEDYCSGENKVIVTTHKKLLNNKSEIIKEFKIIIDEDILFTSIKNSCVVNIDDLKKLKNINKVKQFLRKYKESDNKYILSEPTNSYVSYEIMAKRGITTNVNGFMSATALGIKGNTVSCFLSPVLMKTKYTILSATANENIYKLFFSDIPIRCFNCKEAKYKGRLIQDCTRSYSSRR